MLVLLLLFFKFTLLYSVIITIIIIIIIIIILLIYISIFLLLNCLDSLHSRSKGDIILFRNDVSSLRNEVHFLSMTNRRRVD